MDFSLPKDPDGSCLRLPQKTDARVSRPPGFQRAPGARGVREVAVGFFGQAAGSL